MLTPNNPTTGEALPIFPSLDATKAKRIVGMAVTAAPLWADTPIAERADALRRVAKCLRDAKHELARLMAEEMGKPLREGLAEVEKSAGCAEYYADNGAQFLAAETLASDASHSYVKYQPMVLHVAHVLLQ